MSITDFINALSSSSLHPSSFTVEDSRCLLFADFSSDHNFFHFVSCRACPISYGQPWLFRLPSATWYVEPLTFFLSTKFVANSGHCRASLPLDLIFGPRYLRYYPLHEKLCATLAGVMRSCHKRRTHRTSSQQKYKDGLLRVVTVWSYLSAWNPFLWPPSASALRSLQRAIQYQRGLL